MENEEEITGEKLRELRKKFGLTQQEVSKETGITRSKLSDYENGAKMNKSMAVLLSLYFEKKSKLF